MYRMSLPPWLPQRGWQITKDDGMARGFGYLRYTSRKKHPWLKRGERAHRAVIRYLLGSDGVPLAALDPGWHVHHQNFDKTDCTPENLIYLPKCLNPRRGIGIAYALELIRMQAAREDAVAPSRQRIPQAL